MSSLLPRLSASASASRLIAPRASGATLRAQLPCATISNSRSRLYSTRPTPEGMDAGEKVIYEKLSAKFPGNTLEVQDVSGGCGSFYAIEISSPAFKGLSTIKQHKLVNACLKEDIKDIHGLQLKTIPEE